MSKSSRTNTAVPMKVTTKPFVKWAGGKRGIIHHLLSHLPPGGFKGYYEPFLGGGALFFQLLPPRSCLNDLNQELITTYEVVKGDLPGLISKLEVHQANHSKEYFYKVRNESESLSPTEVAARLIYLNKTCYNGLYRVNAAGKFNVPLGRYKNPAICDVDTLSSCHLALQDAEITCGSYDSIRPTKGDFVYLDPPYHNTYGGYNPVSFDEHAQNRLKEFCDQLDASGVQFMLSNSNSELIRSIYSRYNTVELSVNRYINSNPTGRSGTKEVLVTNYETGEKC